MNIQPIQSQQQLNHNIPTEARPADLKWLGMVNDQVLMTRAKEIASETAAVNPAATIFAGISSKLTSWKFAEDSWHVFED